MANSTKPGDKNEPKIERDQQSLSDQAMENRRDSAFHPDRNPSLNVDNPSSPNQSKGGVTEVDQSLEGRSNKGL